MAMPQLAYSRLKKTARERGRLRERPRMTPLMTSASRLKLVNLPLIFNWWPNTAISTGTRIAFG